MTKPVSSQLCLLQIKALMTHSRTTGAIRANGFSRSIMNRLLQICARTECLVRTFLKVRNGPSDPRHHSRLFSVVGWLAVASSLSPNATAHTLPVSYLRIVTNPGYVHLELIFNPFELTFISEVDGNKDGELDPGELKESGTSVARRVSAAIKLLVNDQVVAAETVGMDPDMSGHHVRLRAHFKVEARGKPVTLISDLQTVTSASHLVQVTFQDGERRELAQLDSRSRKAAFNLTPSGTHKSERSNQDNHDRNHNPQEKH